MAGCPVEAADTVPCPRVHRSPRRSHLRPGGPPVGRGPRAVVAGRGDRGSRRRAGGGPPQPRPSPAPDGARPPRGLAGRAGRPRRAAGEPGGPPVGPGLAGGGPHRRGAGRPRAPAAGAHPGRRGRLAAGPARPRGPGAAGPAGLGAAARGPRPAGRPASRGWPRRTGPWPICPTPSPTCCRGWPRRPPGRGGPRRPSPPWWPPTSTAPRPGSAPSVGRRTRRWWPCGWSRHQEHRRFAGVLQLQSQRDPSLVIDAFDLWSAPEVDDEALRRRRGQPPAGAPPGGQGVVADRSPAGPAPADLAGPAGPRGRRPDGAGRRRPRGGRGARPVAGRADGDRGAGSRSSPRRRPR